MKRKKKVSCIALCMLFCVASAFAAPVREQRSMALTGFELSDMRELFDTFAYAALLDRENSMALNSMPSQNYIEGVLQQVISRGLLGMVTGNESRITVSESELTQIYDQLFTIGDLTTPFYPHSPGITASTDGLTFNISKSKSEYVGAYIYEMREVDGFVIAYADIYIEGEFDFLPADAPDDLLTWTANAVFYLQRDASAAYGVKLSGYDISMEYLASEWQDYVDGNLGFQVRLPDIFLSDLEKTATGFTARFDNDAAVMTLDCTPNIDNVSLEEYAEALKAEDTALHVTPYQGISMLCGEREGQYVVMYISNDVLCGFTLTFPPERAEEFLLYGELIRNSLVVYAISVG